MAMAYGISYPLPKKANKKPLAIFFKAPGSWPRGSNYTAGLKKKRNSKENDDMPVLRSRRKKLRS
jgi:hypothetical protein